MNSNTHPKQVFVATVGTTPQIFTECLYVYTHPHYGYQRKFDRIVALTTREGAEKLSTALFKEGRLAQMETDLGVEKGYFQLKREDIIILKDEGGEELDDVRQNADAEVLSGQFLHLIKDITDDDGTCLTATVAGGRKTMSAMMALAFQLYARESDELIHILPPTAKFGDPEWFYPGDPSSTSEKLEISNVPVLKVGRYLLGTSNDAPGDLLKRVQTAIRDLEPLKSLEVDGKVLIINKVYKIDLPPQNAAFFRMFVKLHKSKTCESDCEGCDSCTMTNEEIFEAFPDSIAPELKSISRPYSPSYEESYKRWRGLDNPPKSIDAASAEKQRSTYVSEMKTNLNKKILKEGSKGHGFVPAACRKAISLISIGKAPTRNGLLALTGEVKILS
ncbi:MAG: CRISPR-associated ring nuclease Csm6 [Candidatus Marinimicrobia bacterium]|nr:CRISPR-associated ring nuclease Csm6 [Candidatus Neomarinimicrobiota bacterium]